MLYSIIPPILIVLSLVGIIIFLMKKAPKIAQAQRESEQISKNNQRDLAGNILGKDNFKRPQKFPLFWFFWDKLKKVPKIIFLKLGTLFTSWSGLGKKRRNRLEEQEDVVKDRNFERKERDQIKPEAYSRSMISQKVTLPNGAVEKKDLFEKILIDRIASNPKDVEAYERLGEYYSEIENWEYAKECFKQVMKLDSKNQAVKMKMKKLERLLMK